MQRPSAHALSPEGTPSALHEFVGIQIEVFAEGKR